MERIRGERGKGRKGHGGGERQTEEVSQRVCWLVLIVTAGDVSSDFRVYFQSGSERKSQRS